MRAGAGGAGEESPGKLMVPQPPDQGSFLLQETVLPGSAAGTLSAFLLLLFTL